MPHGHCFLWRADILSLHVISDAIIVVSYFLIPLFIYKYLRAKRIKARLIPLLFVGFIFSCGITHLFTIWNFWHGHYWVSGWFKAACALLSLATVYVLAKSYSLIASLPSFEDLAEINRSLEEKIEERTNELTERNQDLNQMMSILGHDFNNALAIILGHVELIKSVGGPSEMVEKSLNNIYSVGKNLSHLITDIQKLGALQKQDLRLANIDLAVLIDEIAKTFETSESFSEVKIINLMPSHFEIRGVESLLFQLFQNLISNAIKYKKPGVPVNIEIGSYNRGKELVVYVKDDGQGIAKEELSEIFSMFKRGSDIDSSIQGHGIGLSFCRKIAKLHKGDITCESSKGQGSIFRVSFS